MKIAMCHYHLNRGGVNQVIANHVSALESVASHSPVEQIAILYGGRREGWSLEKPSRLRLSLVEVDGLDYDASRVRCRALADQFRATLGRLGFLPTETVVHVHNHALGKNVSLPGALAELAGDGFGLLLQIHDFAEDFRPENYRALTAALAPHQPALPPDQLYPQGGRLHYAVLNRRDHGVLRHAGVVPDRLHLLPNPVTEPRTLPDRQEVRRKLSRKLGIAPNERLLVYPVRGIRRKNLGEALFWAALAQDRTRVAITLAPLNPVEQPGYRRWRDFAATTGLPCEFEFGVNSGLSFPEVQSAADRILTTSVAEGFGMVFLETWLVQRILIGRDLPEITADFVESGLQLANLRARVPVPIDWVGKVAFQRELETGFSDVLRAYQQRIPAAAQLHSSAETLMDDGWVDFGVLTSPLQQKVIERVLSDSHARDRLSERNAWIAGSLELRAVDEAVLMQNKAAVRIHYSLARSGERLVDIYQCVLASSGDGPVSALPGADGILSGFLDISRFHPIRTER
ncbi:MAG: hypothetical protein ACC628_15005 [Pirellulaceae bacterium]